MSHQIDSQNTTKTWMELMNKGVTSAHAAARIAAHLEASGFTELKEADDWKLKPGQCAFIRRGDSSIIAFRVGEQAPEQSGFRIIGAHTDVPGLRLKPNGAYTQAGYRMLGVEVYGGPILASWTDRDLTLAGRVYLRPSKQNEAPKVKLVQMQRPLCRIPQVAIHLNRTVNDEGLKLNKQTQLPPLIGLDQGEPFDMATIKSLLADELGVNQDAILETILEVVDTQPATLYGLKQELVASGRIDNLAGCHACLMALQKVEAGKATQVAAFFDSEEIGSATYNGAGSNLLDVVLERISGNRPALLRALANTIMISNDGAHAVHPNYADLHEPRHKPVLNKGPVLKINANERYVTHGVGRAHFALLCEEAQVTYQKIVVRTDMPCGSTIGPALATRLGIVGLDVGIPMLSMHSIRETAGTSDQTDMIHVLAHHLQG